MMLTSIIARARSLWRGVRRRSTVEAEMAEEFRLHLELRAEDLVRSGMSPAEARRRARLEFGCIDSHLEAGETARGLRPFDELRFSWLDIKLGIRMLARYPGLTLVGGLAMAFAIWVSAGTFEFISQVLHPKLSLPDGDRIVGIQMWDAARGRVQAQVLHDFTVWRRELRSVQELGAFRTVQRNLITSDGSTEPVEVAEITASAFRLTRVPPVLGRALVDTDERLDAAPAAVIGHRVWQTRFGGDSAVVGRVVRLGGGQFTIVGVMPEDFGFPISNELWVPLRHRATEHARGQGPDVQIFGRLAPGVTREQARTELVALGIRLAAEFPQTHDDLRPRIMPYAASITNIPGTEALLIGSSNIFLVMLLVLIGGNVALLMFARAATRETELAVRSALGASRSRIITQLFAEALVLGAISAVVGLAGVSSGLRWGMRVVEAEFLHGNRLPFWFHASLSPSTLLYAALLTLFGAAIAGVLPAFKVTRGLQARLRQVGSGGGGLRFGGVWTVVIVCQVAVTVAFPVTAFFVHRDAEQIRSIDVASPVKEYLTVRLDMDRESSEGAPLDTSGAAFLARFGARQRELARRLATEPGVMGVTFAERLPYMYHPHRLVDVDDGGAAPIDPRWLGYRVSGASVDPGYFDVLRAPILAGRTFLPGDAAEAVEPETATGARGGVVIVNQSFVKLVLGGRNPIGRRVRYTHFEQWTGRTPAERHGPWYEIVGVVPDLGMSPDDDPKVAGLYHPMVVGSAAPVHLAIHVRGDPIALAPRLRALALAVDPTLRVSEVLRMDQIRDTELQFLDFWLRLTALVSCIAVILSLAGIYSVMSFTVARRTREIGVRIALGASARRVVVAIFARPIKQVALGVAAGGMLVALLMLGASAGDVSIAWILLLVAYAAFMMAVCLLACVLPTLRALRIQPTEALRAEG